MESRKDKWLDATITGPFFGKCSSPVTRALNTVRSSPVTTFCPALYASISELLMVLVVFLRSLLFHTDFIGLTLVVTFSG